MSHSLDKAGSSRSSCAILVMSLCALLSLLIVMTVVHEGTHLLVALLLQIPIQKFTWFDPSRLAPVIVPITTEVTPGIAVVSYAGGIVTGVLFLAAFALKRAWFRESISKWFLGLYLVGFGFWQLSQGILEGGFQAAYATNSAMVFGPIAAIGYAAAILGGAIYWRRYPLPMNADR